MRQKTKVARATVPDPEILIMDEPFQGTDPSTRHLLMNKMKEWSEKGKTIMISSHILHDVENLTDRIILINNGRMLASGDRHEIRKLMDHIPRQVKVSPIDKANLRILAKRMLDEEWVRAARVDEEQGEILLETDRAETFYLELPKILQNEKIAVTKINSDDDSLDSLWGATLSSLEHDNPRAWFQSLDADIVLLDGTFWDDHELKNRVQTNVPHPPVSQSLELLGNREDGDPRIVFIHLNHTNPLHYPDSEQYQQVNEMGWEVGTEGMEFVL